MLNGPLPTEPPEWVGEYIDIPFDECNCWQLVCKVYRDQFGLSIPTYANEYENDADKKNIEKIYNREMQIWKPCSNLLVGTVIVCRVKGQPWHAGLAVAKNLMLHTERELSSVLERYNGIIWKKRIIGFYRWPGISSENA